MPAPEGRGTDRRRPGVAGGAGRSGAVGAGGRALSALAGFVAAGGQGEHHGARQSSASSLFFMFRSSLFCWAVARGTIIYGFKNRKCRFLRRRQYLNHPAAFAGSRVVRLIRTPPLRGRWQIYPLITKRRAERAFARGSRVVLWCGGKPGSQVCNIFTGGQNRRPRLPMRLSSR